MKKLLIIALLFVVGCENPTTSKDCAGVTGGTAELDNCDTCDSDLTNDCVPDCAGVWGGDSVEDECGNCNGDCEEIDGIVTCSENELNVIHPDCFGVCGGESVDDECGVCGGEGIPEGECDCDGNTLDCLNVCGGDATTADCAITCTSGVFDCAGVCDGTAVEDECGVCNGDGSTCNISYSSTIQPIFTTKCTNCHGTSGGLTLTSYSGLMNGGNSGDVVISGNGSESRLIQKLRGTALGSQMPASGCCLEEATINFIERWIDEGAMDN